jgi:hypothetical protein
MGSTYIKLLLISEKLLIANNSRTTWEKLSTDLELLEF